MIELNLLPDVKKEFIRAQRTRNTVISIAIIVTIAAGALTALLVSYVYAAQPILISTKTAEIQRNADDLQKKPEIDKYLTVQNQLDKLNTLHSERYTYSRAFDYLQQLNPGAPNNVALSSVTLDKDLKTLEIQGVSRNFQALNVFQNTLENASLTYKLDEGEATTESLFEQVVLQEANLTNVNNLSLVSFKIQLVYPEAAFLSTSRDIKVEIPNLVTSDADRNAPQVFGTELEGLGQ